MNPPTCRICEKRHWTYEAHNLLPVTESSPTVTKSKDEIVTTSTVVRGRDVRRFTHPTPRGRERTGGGSKLSCERNRVQLEDWLIRYGLEPQQFRFSEQDDRGRVIFCTASHSYVMNFTDDYLGCIVSSRIVRAGEDWTRGTDLPDGKFNPETFRSIFQAIFRCEVVDLEPEYKPVLVEAESL